MTSFITIEFENDKAMQKFVSKKLNQLRSSEYFKNEKVGFYLSWDEPLG